MRRKKKNEEEEKSKKLVKVSTTLASIESLTFPLVQEVVLLADFGCKRCEERVAGIVSRFNGAGSYDNSNNLRKCEELFSCTRTHAILH